MHDKETLLSAPAAIKEAMNFEDELMKRFPAFCEPDNDVTTSAVPDETTVDGVRKKFEMFRARGVSWSSLRDSESPGFLSSEQVQRSAGACFMVL